MFEFSFVFTFGLFCFGLFIGAVFSTFGSGGGLLTVPILIMVYALESDIATATSLGVIIFTAISGTLAYMRERRIDFGISFTFMIFAIPGAIAGALLSRWLKDLQQEIDVLQIVFALTIILIGIFKIIAILVQYRKHKEIEYAEKDQSVKDLAVRDNETRPWRYQTVLYRDFSDKHGIEFKYTVKLFPGIILAFLGGFLGAMLGIGGGVIYVPILTMIMGIPAGIATATSTFTILVVNFFAVLLRVSSIKWDYVICLSLGTIISANLVPRFLHKVKSEWILTGFWILAITAAVRLLLKVFGTVI